MKTPQWAKDELTALYNQFGSWRLIKANLNDLSARLGVEIDAQMAYDIIHDESKIAPCGKEKRFDGFWAGYRFCGGLKSCKCAVDNTTQKRISSNLEKYGVASPLQVNAFKEKAQQTNLERYGSKTPLAAEDIKKKIKSTLRERYGVDNPVHSKDYQKKVKETNLKKYGTEWNIVSENNRKKSQETCKQKYGVAYPPQSQEVRNKIEETNVEKYGVKCSLQSQHVRDLIVDRYDGLHPNQISIGSEVVSILQDKEKLSSALKEHSYRSLAQELNVSASMIANYARAHDITPRAHHSRSQHEKSLESFIKTLDVEYVVNDRTNLNGKELDFYFPSYGFAIEINGIYWHSSFFKDRKYHQEKYIECRKRGIRLLMINEDEFINKTEVVRSKIKNILGKSPKGKPAKMLKIAKIDGGQANHFFSIHHLQGRTGNASYAMGAFDGEVLVAAMSFSKQRGTGAIELSRYCTDGKSYAGIFSRLFKHSITKFDFDEVLSFSDNRYSEGDVYEKNGFSFDGEIPVDYRYVIGDSTAHKSNFTKEKISKRFGLDMSFLTERQAMDLLRYPRIYDCGKKRWVWRKNNLAK